jgi:hypothetical protein
MIFKTQLSRLIIFLYSIFEKKIMPPNPYTRKSPNFKESKESDLILA